MINTVGSMAQILQKFDANSWAKKVEMTSRGPLEMPSVERPLDTNGKSFSELLASSVTEVNSLQKDANVAIQRLATGQSKNIHETMLAVERADIAFKAMNQVRTKVIEAYREIMRMQV